MAQERRSFCSPFSQGRSGCHARTDFTRPKSHASLRNESLPTPGSILRCRQNIFTLFLKNVSVMDFAPLGIRASDPRLDPPNMLQLQCKRVTLWSILTSPLPSSLPFCSSELAHRLNGGAAKRESFSMALAKWDFNPSNLSIPMECVQMEWDPARQAAFTFPASLYRAMGAASQCPPPLTCRCRDDTQKHMVIPLLLMSGPFWMHHAFRLSS